MRSWWSGRGDRRNAAIPIRLALFPFSIPKGSVNPWQSRPKNKRIKAIGNRIEIRIWDDLGVFGGLPYPPSGRSIQLSNVAANLGLDCIVPRKRTITPSVEQLVDD